jgi:hypothetical protein
LSEQNGYKAVDAVDVEATWQRLASRPGSQLIDVRTRAEWTYVGTPDLGPIGKRAVLVAWQTFPDQTVDVTELRRDGRLGANSGPSLACMVAEKNKSRRPALIP